MHPDHKHKTSVITPWGLFAFKAIPFGLKTSAQTMAAPHGRSP